MPVLAKATIHVSDTNDNAPIMKFGNTPVKVNENKEPGIFVLHLSVKDKDKGENGRVICWLEDDSAFELKQHSSEIYVLLTRISLDRELMDKYNLTVFCKDNGWPVLENTAYIGISVVDENDHHPRFKNEKYVINLSESEPIGTNLLQVEAEDADIGVNGQITFSYKISNYDINSRKGLVDISKDLSQNENKNGNANDPMVETLRKWFHLNTDTGLFTVKNEIDYEKVTKVYIEVLAQDSGLPEPRISSVPLIITIFDVNDEPPVFSSTAFSFGIKENQPPGSEIGHVTASDLDSPANDKFTFAIVEPHHFHDQISSHYSYKNQEKTKRSYSSDLSSSRERVNRSSSKNKNPPNFNTNKRHSPHQHKHQSIDPYDWFTIDPDSGLITTVRFLDREQHSVYRFWVTATNVNHPFFVASAEVTVHVADVNDNPPLIFFPPSDNYPFHIPVFAGRNYKITKIVASDADVGDNEKLLFSIVKGNDDKLFEINPESGELLVAKDEAFTSNEITRSYARKPDSSDLDSIHKLMILVKDFGIPEKTAVINIEVYINKSIQFLSGIPGSEQDEDSFSSFLSSMSLDLSSFTGKYVLCLIATISFIFVVVIIMTAVFARRFFLRRRKKQTLVMLKKSNLNNVNNEANNTSKFNTTPSAKLPIQYSGSKVENNLYATVKPNALKNATTSNSFTNDLKNLDPIDRNSPYFKSIDISNDINEFVFQEKINNKTHNNTYQAGVNPSSNITNNNSNSSTSSSSNHNNNFYNSPRLASINMNGMSTFQREKDKMFCHEEALSHFQAKISTAQVCFICF